MLERVAQRLARDAIGLVADDRIQLRDGPSTLTSISGGRRPRITGQFRADRGDAVGQIVQRRCRRAQPVHRVAAFGDRHFRLVERLVQPLPRLVRTRRDDVGGRLEA